MNRRWTTLGLLLLLVSCHKAQPLHANHATHANEPPISPGSMAAWMARS